MKIFDIPLKYKSIIEKISSVAKENSFEAYAVGGFVRDLFLNRQPKDLDIMVESLNEKDDLAHKAGIRLSEIIADKYSLHKPVVFEKFGTSKLFFGEEEVEFIMPRKEYYETNSRNPKTGLGSLQQDALRRDFTINALFLRLSDMQVLDLTGKGKEDINKKIIRVTDPDNADIIFKQDPLRILRAIRQSIQLGFDIEPVTYKAMAEASKRIHIIAPERIREELNYILMADKPSKAFIMMEDLDLLKEILPEIDRLKSVLQPEKYHDNDVFTHTLNVLDRTEKDLILRMAALLHDIGKYKTYTEENGEIHFYGHEKESAIEAEEILKRLRYSKDFSNQVVSVISNHMHVKMYDDLWSDSAIRRFVKKCGKELDLILKFEEADYGKDKPMSNSLFLKKRIEELKKKNLLYPKEDLISGKELMEYFNKQGGPWLKEAKKKVDEALFEKPDLTKDEAFEIVKEILKDQKS